MGGQGIPAFNFLGVAMTINWRNECKRGTLVLP